MLKKRLLNICFDKECQEFIVAMGEKNKHDIERRFREQNDGQGDNLTEEENWSKKHYYQNTWNDRTERR